MSVEISFCRLEKKVFVNWKKKIVVWENNSVGKKILSVEIFFMLVGEKGFVGWKTKCWSENILLVVNAFLLVEILFYQLEKKIVGWKKVSF